MNKIKNALLICSVTLAAVVGLSMLATGCKTSQIVTQNSDGTYSTNTTRTIDTNRVASVAKQAAIDGTVDVLAQNPKLEADFQLAANDLNQLATNPAITLESVLAIVQRLPVTALKSNTAKISFEGASLLISAIDLPEVPVQAASDLQVVAKAIADGVNYGIEENAIAAPPIVTAPATGSNAPSVPPATN